MHSLILIRRVLVHGLARSWSEQTHAHLANTIRIQHARCQVCTRRESLHRCDLRNLRLRTRSSAHGKQAQAASGAHSWLLQAIEVQAWTALPSAVPGRSYAFPCCTRAWAFVHMGIILRVEAVVEAWESAVSCRSRRFPTCWQERLSCRLCQRLNQAGCEGYNRAGSGSIIRRRRWDCGWSGW